MYIIPAIMLGRKRNLIRGLCADIKDVSFSLDSKIFGEDFEVLPLGIGENAYQMQDDILFCTEKRKCQFDI